MQYEGGVISPHTLYVQGSEPINVIGKVSFNVFGNVRMNGVPLTSCTLSVMLREPTKFEVQKDGAILFNQAPIPAKDTGKHIPVPPVPDMQDAAMQQMYAMFEDWAVKRGMRKPMDLIDQDQDIEEEDLDIDEDFDMDFPLDQENENVLFLENDEDVPETQEEAEIGESEAEETTEETTEEDSAVK